MLPEPDYVKRDGPFLYSQLHYDHSDAWHCQQCGSEFVMVAEMKKCQTCEVTALLPG